MLSLIQLINWFTLNNSEQIKHIKSELKNNLKLKLNLGAGISST
jgi:hypothetical protein